MTNNDMIVYGIIFFGGLFVAIFEVYRAHNEVWKLKRYVDKRIFEEKALMYMTTCNTFVQNCRYMIDAQVIIIPEEYKDKEDELMLNNFFALIPDARNYLIPKETGYDVRLDDSDVVPEGRSKG